MFDNVLNQSAADLLTSDIKSAKLPGAILFRDRNLRENLQQPLKLPASCPAEEKFPARGTVHAPVV